MRGTAKSKMVTSGRLTGTVRGQLSRRRGTPDPGPACPEPAYSLYSTSTGSEEQVSSLHKGLDRCAALLNNILQADKAGLPRAVKGVAAKSTPCSARGKKTIRNTKTDERGHQPVQPVPGTTTCPPAVKVHLAEKQTSIHPPQLQPPIYTPQTSIHPPQSQPPIHPPKTSIHPPQPLIHPLQTSIHPLQPQPSIHQPQTSIHPPQHPIHPPQTSIHPPQLQLPIYPTQSSIHPPQPPIYPPQTSIHSNQTSISYCEAECDKEEEFVPVRETNDHSSAVRQCTLQMSNMQFELGQVDTVPQDSYSKGDCSAKADVEVKTVQGLLRELKALIAGQEISTLTGCLTAERLLSNLEQTLSLPLIGAGSSNIRTEPELLSLHSQNYQLSRGVILNQQLKQRGRADTQNLEMLCYSEVLTLQEELSSAQSRLQEVQEDLTELRKALEDTQSRLIDKEAENALIQTDLVATRSRLLDSEQEKSELASLAQQRLEDIGNLNRILQGHDLSNRPPVVDSSVSDTEHFNQHRPDPADRITQFLMSLGQLEPSPPEHVCVAAEREQKTLRDRLAQPEVRPGDSACHQGTLLDPSHCHQEVQSCMEQCRHQSDWSTRSESSFDTRDEAAFRDGLAALDASIASLQKTIQLDLRR